jgi:hypothetical protein
MIFRNPIGMKVRVQNRMQREKTQGRDDLQKSACGFVATLQGRREAGRADF